MRPTPRGLAWILGALLTAVVGMALRVPEFLAIACVALLLALVSALMVISGRAVTVRAHVPARAERDSNATALVTWPEQRRSGVRFLGRRGRTVTDVRWGEGQAWLPLPTQRRGVRLVGPWRFERIDPWGLFRRRLGEVGESTILITPRIHPVSLASLPMAFVDHSGAAEAGATTFASLREYVVGDEIRHIHWRSSAKTGSLMTRQYVDLTRPRVHLVLVDDTRAHRDDSDFEAVVDLTASVATVALAAGFDVDIRTTSGEQARGSAWLETLSQVSRHDTTAHRILLRLPAATTMVITGHGDRGWWERIPSAGMVRP